MGSDLVFWLYVLAPLIVVVGLARATQLAMHDKVFEKPRKWITDGHLGSYPAFSIQCPWCTSTQLALAIALLLSFDATRLVTLVVLAALTASLFATLVDRLIDRSPHLADEPAETAIVKLHQRLPGAVPAPRPEAPDQVAAAFAARPDREG